MARDDWHQDCGSLCAVVLLSVSRHATAAEAGCAWAVGHLDLRFDRLLRAFVLVVPWVVEQAQGDGARNPRHQRTMHERADACHWAALAEVERDSHALDPLIEREPRAPRALKLLPVRVIALPSFGAFEGRRVSCTQHAWGRRRSRRRRR